MMGGELLDLEEARKLLLDMPVMFPGEDQWAAVYDNGKDWIQLGNKCHQKGTSHN